MATMCGALMVAPSPIGRGRSLYAAERLPSGTNSWRGTVRTASATGPLTFGRFASPSASRCRSSSLVILPRGPGCTRLVRAVHAFHVLREHRVAVLAELRELVVALGGLPHVDALHLELLVAELHALADHELEVAGHVDFEAPAALVAVVPRVDGHVHGDVVHRPRPDGLDVLDVRPARPVLGPDLDARHAHLRDGLLGLHDELVALVHRLLRVELRTAREGVAVLRDHHVDRLCVLALQARLVDVPALAALHRRVPAARRQNLVDRLQVRGTGRTRQPDLLASVYVHGLGLAART